MPVTWIVTDLGGVCIGDVHFPFLADYAQRRGWGGDILIRLRQAHNRAWQEAKIKDGSETEYWDNIIRLAGITDPTVTGTLFCDLVRKNGFLDLLPNTHSVLEEARRGGYHLGILSNHLSEQTDYIFEQHPEFVKTFEPGVILVSSQLGLAKPDPAIFAALMQRIRAQDPTAQPANVAFIDDKSENISQARSLGFQAICFRAERDSPDKLRRELEALGVHLAAAEDRN
ncbi:hypothetical protein PAPYR_8259 [Paratrimastix pyriformis]|uniref:Uncharacterized protein n=1 Tax=Paratrimastix pyriformis TaxID=342808 RepID=A0ABQ8UB45_9EUKA|nr:hypothetical protein PAPYR_8259 [Paratrimastix pyriformis]